MNKQDDKPSLHKPKAQCLIYLNKKSNPVALAKELLEQEVGPTAKRFWTKASAENTTKTGEYILADRSKYFVKARVAYQSPSLLVIEGWTCVPSDRNNAIRAWQIEVHKKHKMQKETIVWTYNLEAANGAL